MSGSESIIGQHRLVLALPNLALYKQCMWDEISLSFSSLAYKSIFQVCLQVFSGVSREELHVPPYYLEQMML